VCLLELDDADNLDGVLGGGSVVTPVMVLHNGGLSLVGAI